MLNAEKIKCTPQGLRKTFACCIIFYWLPLLTAHAQNALPLSFTSLTVNNGLSQNSVTAIYQDKKGLLWFGTQEGLNCYDSYTFKVYKHNPDISNSLSSSSVLCINQKGIDTLWVGTEGGGLNLVNLINGNISHYTANDSIPYSLNSNRIRHILYDSEGRTWLATFGGGINRFDISTGKFFHYLPDSANAKSFSNFVVKIIEDKKHRLWLTTRNGFYRFNPTDQSFLKIELNDSNDSTALAPRLTDVVEDDKGLLWIGSANQGMFIYNSETNKVVKSESIGLPVQESFVNKLYFDKQHQLWIGYWNSGIDVIDCNTKQIQHYESDENSKFALSGNQVVSFFEDDAGLIWAGTSGNGVNVTDINTKRLSAFRYHKASQKINQKTEVYAISKLNDDLFIGSSESGMIQYTSNDSVIIYQKSDATGSIQGDDVWAMLKIDNNQLLVGTYGNGLSYFNAATQRFSQNKKQALFDSLRMQGTLIMYLMHDSKQRLWIATQRMGLYCYDAAIDSLTHFHPDEPVNKINDATVLTVYEDSNGNIWIGGFEKGIDVISTKGQLINHYEYNSLNKNTPGSNSITCFLRQKNLIWFGTIGGGLNSFDIENKKFYRLTEANGLPDNTVYGIINDDSDLWISTNRGLCRVIPYLNDTTLTILSRGYNTSDGLPANEFNQGGYYKDDDGIFYFGSVNGLVSFKPALIKDNPYKPKVILTSFKVFEKPFAIDSGIAYKKVIELNYNEDFFSFEFAAASYFLSEENQYAYLLEGFNKGWIQNGNRHYISFTNLSPGTYHLKIKASNNDGIWGDEKQLITIIINPPFWMTWWFRLMIVALIAGTIYQIVNTRIKRIKKEERRKADFAKRIAETETKALRAQMNPHFIFNSLNAIHKYIWEHEQTLASDYLTRFSKLMRMILENSSHQKIPLDKELECLRIYIELESLRFENKFDFKIQIHSEHDAEDILIPPLLLQPFAENAIIHGLMKKKEGQRLLDIQLKTTATDLICIIDDTGIGRKAAAEQRTATSHKSLGMSVTHDRIEIMNIESERKTQLSVTDKTDAEDKASGTRVEIILPLELQF